MIVGIVSINLSIFACSSCFNIIPKVSTKLICSSISVFCGSKDKLFHDCNWSLFVFSQGLYLVKNIFFMVVRSLKSALCCWNHINAFLSSVCSNNSIAFYRVFNVAICSLEFNILVEPFIMCYCFLRFFTIKQ